MFAECDGKEAFESFTLASKVLIRCNARKHKGNVYKCKVCNKFHIGTSVRRKKRLIDNKTAEIEIRLMNEI